MAEHNWLQRHGLTRTKAALIIVLSLVLVAVLVTQYGGGRPGASPAATGGHPQRTASEAANAGRRPALGERARAVKKPAGVAELERKAWPVLSPASVARFDPLGIPPVLAQRQRVLVQPRELKVERPEPRDDAQLQERQIEEAKRREAARQGLKKLGVGLVIAGDRGKTAVIGSRRVHIGDVIDGFVVRDIRPDGVILGEAKRP